MLNCIHCGRSIEPAPAYLGVEYIHTSGYQHCEYGGAFLATKATAPDLTSELTPADVGAHYVTVHDGTSELCLCTDDAHDWTDRVPFDPQRAVAGAMAHRAKGGLIGD